MKNKFLLLLTLCMLLLICTSCVINDVKTDKYIVSETKESGQDEDTVINSDASTYNVYCYFEDVDYMQCLKNKKIKLIPAMEITYKQYKNALENNNNVILDGKAFTIDTSMVEDYGYACLEDEFNSYPFVEPDEFNYNVSVVENYLNKNPIEVAISDDLMIRYGVLGYDKSNEPYGYESSGRKVVYTADEYFQHFEEYSFNTYYRATISNGKLTILDVMYHD